jgi:chlorite dismutase
MLWACNEMLSGALLLRSTAGYDGSMPSATVSFAGSDRGRWEIERILTISGAGLPAAARLDVRTASSSSSGSSWVLSGVKSNTRYVERQEHEGLVKVQAELGRSTATCAALIPISKSDAWWGLLQDERRQIFEETSHHIEIGLKYLPPIARQLYHSRDLGEPFDFLTWFEFAPEHASDFDALVGELRQTEEWKFVSREIEVRLSAPQ